MHELALFAGAGGGILGGHLLGWRTVCAVERDAYAAQVLAQRQNDGILRPFPIWSDVTIFDGRPWRGLVDVVSGGFPCQDISAAGKGAGITGARSGMWKEMARIIGEVRPRFVFVENSPMLTTIGLGVVLGDLAALGFDAEWGVLSAADVGAPHLRERIWILAHSNLRDGKQGGCIKSRVQQPSGVRKNVSNSISIGLQDCSHFGSGKAPGPGEFSRGAVKRRFGAPCGCWSTEPDVGRVADGVAFRVDRLKGIGNGQVPAVAATAFELLRARFEQ